MNHAQEELKIPAKKPKLEGVDLSKIGHRGVPLPASRRVTQVQPFKFSSSNADQKVTGLLKANGDCLTKGSINDQLMQAGTSKDGLPESLQKDAPFTFKAEIKQENVDEDAPNTSERPVPADLKLKPKNPKEVPKNFDSFMARQLGALSLKCANSEKVTFREIRQAAAQFEKDNLTLRAEVQRLESLSAGNESKQ